MEGNPNRGRGGSWKRGGGGGNEHGTSEHRGRGGRGRSKRRDHYRGRGGGAAVASGFQNRHGGSNPDEEEEEEEWREVFARRKLDSNWDRYEESEKEAQNDNDTPTQRGTDFHVLLESAGDSFTQFRFSEEKEWEMDSLAACQLSAVFVDLPALAQSLQELPLHQRLNLESELVQVSTPAELPIMTTMASKQNRGLAGLIKPSPALAPKGPSTSLGLSSAAIPVSVSAAQSSAYAAKPLAEDMDEDLDQLLSLQSPVSEEPSATLPGSAGEEGDEVVRDRPATPVGKEAEPIPEVSAPTEAEPVKQDMTEEDLEDWLDSMIS